MQKNTNLHAPQRLEGESFADYKIRQKDSHDLSKKNSQIGQGGYHTRDAVRAELRKEGKMKYLAGSYGEGLRGWITEKNLAVLANKE